MKKFLSLILSLSFVLSVWAMPQFDQYIPDMSGEYVYYKDNTFLRESYLGILYYDDSTIQLRYIAPRDEKNQLPENEVSILFSINPENKNMELTGERILTTVIPGTDDVILVNYLHDILYEFTSHRKRVQNLNEREIIIVQDYEQFSGRVNIVYDATIPIFNIRDIRKPSGEVLLDCVTTGRLESNGDQSFNNFKGFPNEKTEKSKKHYKKGKSEEHNIDGNIITLDDNWKQIAENFWLLGDDAVLTISGMGKPQTQDNALNNLLFIRKFIQSTQNSYKDLDTLDIQEEDGNLSISVEVYNPGKRDQIIKRIISKNEKSTSYYMLSMPIYKEAYIANKKYFDKIIDSYEY